MTSVVLIPKFELKGDLRACRVCLATDTNLLYLPTHPLANTFDVLTGTPLSAADGLPQHICRFCSSLLRKYAELKDKCLAAYVTLQSACSQNQMVTTDYIRGIDTTHLKHNLFITYTLNIDFVPTSKESSNNGYEQVNSNSQVDIKLGNCDNIDTDLLCGQTVDYEYENNDNDDYDSNEEMINKISDKNKAFAAENINDSVLKYEKDDICHDDSLNKSKKQFIKCIDIDHVASDVGTETDIVAPKINTDCGIKTNTMEGRDTKQKPLKRVERIRKSKEKKIQENKKERQWSLKRIADWSKAYNFDIKVLSKEEQRQRVEARQDEPTYVNSNFKCKFCFRGFSLESEFDRHVIFHDPRKGEHVCFACRFRFPTQARLSKHRTMHRISATCKECNRNFSTLSEVQEHFNSHKGVKFECEHCDKCFIKWKSKVEHIRIHHGSTLCVICGVGFTGARGLRLHMKLTHPEALDAVCSTCSVQFHSAEALSKHACEPGALPCAQCGDNLSTEEALKVHQKEHRRRRKHKKTAIECLECGDIFAGEKLHKMHLNRVHNIKSSLTVQRPRGVGKTGNYKNKHVHKRCICEICGLYHRSQAALKEHQRIHTGEKPYQCDYCSKNFRQKGQLQIHIYTHTDERPYKCPECPKAFKQPMHRNRHRLVHTKERPAYDCSLCDKTYQSPRGLKLHVKTAHLNEPWPKSGRRRIKTVNKK